MAIFTKPKLVCLFFLILSLFLACQCDENPRGQDPRRQLESCLSQCQMQSEKQEPEQQLQCQRSCVLQYEQQQRERSEEVVEEILTHHHRDPERRLRECQQRCQSQEQGQRQQRQCQQRCQQEYQREQEQQGRRGQTGEEENQGQEPQRRFRECQQRCQRQEQGQQQRQCQQRCEQEFRREQEEQRRGQETGERGGDLNPYERDPERRLRECQQRCQRQEQEQVRQCQQRCQREYRREKEQQRGGRQEGEEQNPQRERETGIETEDNPYLFQSHRFRSRFTARHGSFRVLEKFTERSELLRGIENYRLVVVEFEPMSFMLPHHCDADTIFVAVRGKGTISIANQDEKNSYNLQHGDIIEVTAGSTVSLLNRDNNEKFFIYVLARPVNIPGQFEEFWSGGGENPESFYRAFSSDILETAFKTPRDRIQRLFGQQRGGVVVKATEEQIRATTEHAERSSKKTTKGGESRGPINLLNERPLFSSKFGQFFEAHPERFEQLREVGAAVAFMNINQGGMVLPYYNTKSTRLALVVEGSGRFEMACPHVGGQSQWRGQGSRGGRREQGEEQEQEGNVHYQKVQGSLSVGDVLVVPAGHPITIIATGGSNLRLVGFGVHARNDKKNFLAGQKSIWANVDREAKGLAFNMPGREVEEILVRNQDQSYFVAGPEQRGQQQRGGGQQYLSSILDFVF